MNLRKADIYNIGIDLGNGSVGWSVSDDQGELFKFNGKTTWGSRLFDTAKTAADTRVCRGQRRRYTRRRWRLNLLQEIFEEPMQGVDQDFFTRLRQSHLLAEDKTEGASGYLHPIFNSEEFTESAYYKQFPTIYHLRAHLMQTEDKADLRLIYLALHNIVKARGNFLYEGEEISARNADMASAMDALENALEGWCENRNLTCAFRANKPKIQALLETNMDADDKENPTRRLNRSDLSKKVGVLAAFSSNEELSSKDAKAMSTALAKFCVGLKGDAGKLFQLDEEHKLVLSNEEDVEKFAAACPDDGMELFEALQKVHSSYVLMGILDGAGGQTISACKVEAYQQYGDDLQLLKSLARKFVSKKRYNEFFRGPLAMGVTGKNHRAKDYEPSTAKGYTKYNLVHSADSSDQLKKDIEKLFAGTEALATEEYQKMERALKDGKFLRRLKTSDNGSIPHQFHLEEMLAILENQGRHYPFLLEEKEKLTSLVTFRIPYYVGPLTTKNAAKDKKGNKRFAWSVRQEGMESAKVYPWNWEEVIDRKASAAKFIERLTGACTYLLDEPVMPRSSLLYEEFCVLNELNGLKISEDGDKCHRLSYKDRSDIMEDLFKRKRSVSYKAIQNWFKENRGLANVQVSGAQGVSGFESKLSSRFFFAFDIFGSAEAVDDNCEMVEEIILWSTLFEDRSILREKLEEKYGDRLNADQIRKICKKRFTGWGNLSKKLLCELKAQTDNGPRSVMDVLREGDPNSKRLGESMVLMEVLRNKELCFDELISRENEKLLADGAIGLDDLPGSPALKRPVNQAMRIVDEIVSIVGHAPENIFVEVTREEEARNKGRRTTQRYDKIKQAVDAFAAENPQLLKGGLAQELDSFKDQKDELDRERLMLYFMQNGKCLYSGRDLHIEQLSTYQVDHIIPQSYTKDDSLDNKALVLSEYNQRKSDSLLLDEGIRKKMWSQWKALCDAGMISEKKFKSLTASKISDRQLGGFIARQLVETSQSIKLLQLVLQSKYPEVRIRPVKAGFSSELRNQLGLVKCREANSYHHAHDAYIASEIGRFILARHSMLYDNPVGYTKAVRSFVKAQAFEYSKTGKLPGSASFVVASFMHPGVDYETGEILREDAWTPNEVIARLKRALDYKDCYIVRMPKEDSGAFWDSTIYSPRDLKKQKNLTLPLKKELDPQKYGSYSREQYAYFYIYEAQSKKGRQVIFAQVPVHAAAEIAGHTKTIAEVAEEDAAQRGVTFVRVIRDKIYKYQLIEWNGGRFFITGKQEVRNGTQLAFSKGEIALLKVLANGQVADEKECYKLLEAIVQKCEQYAPRLAKSLKVSTFLENWHEVAKEEQGKILLAVIQVTNAETNRIDLTAIKGSKYAGGIQPIFTNEFSDPKNEIYFIDQSVTGMFEKRTKL